MIIKVTQTFLGINGITRSERNSYSKILLLNVLIFSHIHFSVELRDGRSFPLRSLFEFEVSDVGQKYNYENGGKSTDFCLILFLASIIHRDMFSKHIKRAETLADPL